MRESEYQQGLVKRIKQRFPGAIVIKNDSGLIQGIPDLTVLFKRNWAMLEVKAAEDSPVQPNQEYYIELFDELSFAAFIYPENEEEVLDAIQQSFQPRRKARVS